MGVIYTVFRCRGTVELCELALVEGYQTWVPTYRNEKGEVLPSIAGYIFVPILEWVSFRRWCPERFNSRLLCKFGGMADMTGPVREHFIEPVRVTLEQLRDIEQYVAVKGLEVGHRVEIITGPFKGYEATVARIRGDTIRVSIGDRFVSLPKIFLVGI